MNSKTLYYIHVPKTGGTTCREYLTNLFFEKKIYDSWLYSDALSCNFTEWSFADLIMTHSGMALSEYFPNANYMIVLRDPVDLTLSYYEQILRDDNALSEIARSMSVDDFFLNFNFIKKYANPYTRAFMANSPEKIKYLYYGDEPIDFDSRSIEINHWFDKSKPPYIRYVFSFDDLDSGLNQVSLDYNSYPKRAKKLNNIEHPDYRIKYNEYVEEIERENQADKRLIEMLLSQRKADVDLGNKIYLSNLRRLPRGELSLSANFFGKGWNTPEVNDSNFNIWSCSDSASLHVFPESNIDTVLIYFASYAVEMSGISVKVNNQVANIELVSSADYKHVLGINLDNIRQTAIGYEIEINDIPVYRPSDLDLNSDDKRDLGIYVSKVVLL